MPRNESGLSTHAHCCLCAYLMAEYEKDGRTFAMPANLKNFAGEIAKLTKKDLRSMPGVGKTTADEITGWLSALGYNSLPPNAQVTGVPALSARPG